MEKYKHAKDISELKYDGVDYVFEIVEYEFDNYAKWVDLIIREVETGELYKFCDKSYIIRSSVKCSCPERELRKQEYYDTDLKCWKKEKWHKCDDYDLCGREITLTYSYEYWDTVEVPKKKRCKY